jgi:hypothetical protein
MFRRWIIRSLALAPLTLCMSAWVASYWRSISINYWRNDVEVTNLSVDRGRFMADSSKAFSGYITPGPTPCWSIENRDAGAIEWPFFDASAKFSISGFALWNTGPVPRGISYHGVSVPAWFPTLLSALLLCLLWRKTRPKHTVKGFPVEVGGKQTKA